MRRQVRGQGLLPPCPHAPHPDPSGAAQLRRRRQATCCPLTIHSGLRLSLAATRHSQHRRQPSESWAARLAGRRRPSVGLPGGEPRTETAPIASHPGGFWIRVPLRGSRPAPTGLCAAAASLVAKSGLSIPPTWPTLSSIRMGKGRPQWRPAPPPLGGRKYNPRFPVWGGAPGSLRREQGSLLGCPLA